MTLVPPPAFRNDVQAFGGALAAATSTIRLSALVTGNNYRNPALLAKTITTLDVVSAGRAILGIGAGWFENEHHALGFEFGRSPTGSSAWKRRCRSSPRCSLVNGDWYRVNEPCLRDGIPVLIGGSGENKTFRLAALFADHVNILRPVHAIAHKVAVLAQRCEEIGRGPKTLTTSF